MGDGVTARDQVETPAAPGDPAYGWRYLAIHAGAGFALLFLTLLASDLGIEVGLPAAIAAGLVLGWRLPGNVVLVGSGAIAALVAYGATGAMIAAGPGYEWQPFDELVDSVATSTTMLAALIAYLAAARRRPARAAGPLEVALAGAGLALALGTGVTLTHLALVPAARSFEVPAASGWSEVTGEATWDLDLARLMHTGREAVYVPDGHGGAGDQAPIAMVGVLNRSGSGYGCPIVFDTWPGSPLLDGTFVEQGDVALAAGPAHRIRMAKLADGDTDATLYYLERTRQVGFAREDLCYLLAVVGAPGIPLDASAADALAAAFRFR